MEDTLIDILITLRFIMIMLSLITGITVGKLIAKVGSQPEMPEWKK